MWKKGGFEPCSGRYWRGASTFVPCSIRTFIFLYIKRKGCAVASVLYRVSGSSNFYRQTRALRGGILYWHSGCRIPRVSCGGGFESFFCTVVRCCYRAARMSCSDGYRTRLGATGTTRNPIFRTSPFTATQRECVYVL